jgi:hypothetical protein
MNIREIRRTIYLILKNIAEIEHDFYMPPHLKVINKLNKDSTSWFSRRGMVDVIRKELKNWLKEPITDRNEHVFQCTLYLCKAIIYQNDNINRNWREDKQYIQKTIDPYSAFPNEGSELDDIEIDATCIDMEFEVHPKFKSVCKYLISDGLLKSDSSPDDEIESEDEENENNVQTSGEQQQEVFLINYARLEQYRIFLSDPVSETDEAKYKKLKEKFIGKIKLAVQKDYEREQKDELNRPTQNAPGI